MRKLTKQDIPSMRIKIYEGNKIGGCVTEISSDKTKIIFDYGLNLDDTSQIEIDGLTAFPAIYKAVFISHYHGDHIGSIARILPEVPIYIEEVTYRLYVVMNDFAKDKINLDKLNIKTFKIGEEIEIDDLIVKSFVVDHSAYNACMFLVTDGKEKALYTGDYRDNGKKGKLLLPTIKSIGRLDYLITEGTTLGSNTHSIKKESSLEQDFNHVLKKYDQVFIMMSTANIDRIPIIYKAALKTNHNLIQDLYMAHITTTIGENIPNPSFKNVYVYKPQGYLHRGNVEFREKYVDNSFNDKNDAKKMFEPFVMNVRQGMIRDLKKLKEKGALKNSCLIYSMWSGYKRKDDMIRFLDEVKELGIDLIENDIHASGHASKEVIDEVIRLSGVEEKNLYIIHTKDVKKGVTGDEEYGK